MTVYIPCYFNNITSREENFYVILNQYLRLNYKVVVYWMNKQECKVKDNLTLITGSPVNASIARNKLLTMFYESTEDYAIFSDDDTFLKEEIILRYDCISFTNDYNKELKETSQINTAIVLLRNFKKAYNITPYFDETLEANQDLDFGITLNSIGIKTYRQSTNNIIIYKGLSSMFTNNMNRLYKKQVSLNYILSKHGKYS